MCVLCQTTEKEELRLGCLGLYNNLSEISFFMLSYNTCFILLRRVALTPYISVILKMGPAEWGMGNNY